MKNSLIRLVTGLAMLAAIGTASAQDNAAAAAAVEEVTLNCQAAAMAYDKTELTLKAGTKVKLTLVVPEGGLMQPHNWVLVKPGKEMVVAQGALALAADPKGMEKGYVPEIPDVVAYSPLVQPGKSGSVEFTVPAEAGDYPFICTFPGHFFANMKGVLKVTD